MGMCAHQVLDEEDLIQECKALNGRLIAFLRQPAVLAALLGYLVDAPPPSALISRLICPACTRIVKQGPPAVPVGTRRPC